MITKANNFVVFMGPNLSKANAKPTVTHLVLNALVKEGLLKLIISERVDGINAKAGVP